MNNENLDNQYVLIKESVWKYFQARKLRIGDIGIIFKCVMDGKRIPKGFKRYFKYSPELHRMRMLSGVTR